jgi:hypothetical protein
MYNLHGPSIHAMNLRVCSPHASTNRVQCVQKVVVHLQKHVPQLKEPWQVKTELNNYTLYRYCTLTTV